MKVVFWKDALERVENEKDGLCELHNMHLGIFNNSLYLWSTYITHF